MPIIDGGGTHKKREIIAKTMPRPHASATSQVRPDKEAVSKSTWDMRVI